MQVPARSILGDNMPTWTQDTPSLIWAVGSGFDDVTTSSDARPCWSAETLHSGSTGILGMRKWAWYFLQVDI